MAPASPRGHSPGGQKFLWTLILSFTPFLFVNRGPSSSGRRIQSFIPRKNRQFRLRGGYGPLDEIYDKWNALNVSESDPEERSQYKIEKTSGRTDMMHGCLKINYPNLQPKKVSIIKKKKKKTLRRLFFISNFCRLKIAMIKCDMRIR